jgi:hypothetical protein
VSRGVIRVVKQSKTEIGAREIGLIREQMSRRENDEGTAPVTKTLVIVTAGGACHNHLPGLT